MKKNPINKHYALIGYPLGHSYSPLIHNYSLKKLGLHADYVLKETKKEDLEKCIDELRNGKYLGYNVTIPYKIEVMKYLDEISEEAKAIGSVNTIKRVNNKLIGYNTDYYGFKDEILKHNINPEGKKCFILGTGGASLAILKVLLDLKADVKRVSRNPYKEHDISYDELKKEDDIYLIVNSTPVGMYPNIDNSPIGLEQAKKALYIVDIIFNPTVTKLMTYNENSFNGLEMLVYQALKAEEIWLGEEIDINKDDVLNTIRGEIDE